MSIPLCKNCLYWDPKDLGSRGRGYRNGYGSCRRFPLNTTMKGLEGDRDWCGEFRDRSLGFPKIRKEPTDE